MRVVRKCINVTVNKDKLNRRQLKKINTLKPKGRLHFLGAALEPKVEHFKFDQVNEALSHLESGKARYRIVLSH